MLKGVYSIKDTRNGFVSLTVEENDPTAMRNFANAVMQNGSVLNNFKEDFQLWRIGTFDSDLGMITKSDEDYKPICNATDFIKE